MDLQWKAEFCFIISDNVGINGIIYRCLLKYVKLHNLDLSSRNFARISWSRSLTFFLVMFGHFILARKQKYL